MNSPPLLEVDGGVGWFWTVGLREEEMNLFQTNLSLFLRPNAMTRMPRMIPPTKAQMVPMMVHWKLLCAASSSPVTPPTDGRTGEGGGVSKVDGF